MSAVLLLAVVLFNLELSAVAYTLPAAAPGAVGGDAGAVRAYLVMLPQGLDPADVAAVYHKDGVAAPALAVPYPFTDTGPGFAWAPGARSLLVIVPSIARIGGAKGLGLDLSGAAAVYTLPDGARLALYRTEEARMPLRLGPLLHNTTLDYIVAVGGLSAEYGPIRVDDLPRLAAMARRLAVPGTRLQPAYSTPGGSGSTVSMALVPYAAAWSSRDGDGVLGPRKPVELNPGDSYSKCGYFRVAPGTVEATLAITLAADGNLARVYVSASLEPLPSGNRASAARYFTLRSGEKRVIWLRVSTSNDTLHARACINIHVYGGRVLALVTPGGYMSKTYRGSEPGPDDHAFTTYRAYRMPVGDDSRYLPIYNHVSLPVMVAENVAPGQLQIGMVFEAGYSSAAGTPVSVAFGDAYLGKTTVCKSRMQRSGVGAELVCVSTLRGVDSVHALENYILTGITPELTIETGRLISLDLYSLQASFKTYAVDGDYGYPVTPTTSSLVYLASVLQVLDRSGRDRVDDGGAVLTMVKTGRHVARGSLKATVVVSAVLKGFSFGTGKVWGSVDGFSYVIGANCRSYVSSKDNVHKVVKYGAFIVSVVGMLLSDGLTAQLLSAASVAASVPYLFSDYAVADFVSCHRAAGGVRYDGDVTSLIHGISQVLIALDIDVEGALTSAPRISVGYDLVVGKGYGSPTGHIGYGGAVELPPP